MTDFRAKADELRAKTTAPDVEPVCFSNGRINKSKTRDRQDAADLVVFRAYMDEVLAGLREIGL